MRVADTSALYAAFVGDDLHHAEARLAFRDVEPTIVPTEILVETLGLLQLRVGHARAQAAGAAIRATSHIRVEPSTSVITDAAWSEFEQASGKLSLADAFVIAWCDAEDARPVTFDKEISRRAGGKR